MKDTDYNDRIELVNVGGGWMPANEPAEELLISTAKGELTTFQEVSARDLKFHKCYMLLLSYIYDYMPVNFRRKISKGNFYKWLKHIKGEYKECYTFKDGTKLIEYTSISFAKMTQHKFKEYVSEQLPYIYENVIGACYEGEMYQSIINDIEEKFKFYFNQLF